MLEGEAPLEIAGDGPPSVAGVEKAAEQIGEVVWLGRQPKDQVLALLSAARVLLFSAT